MFWWFWVRLWITQRWKVCIIRFWITNHPFLEAELTSITGIILSYIWKQLLYFIIVNRQQANFVLSRLVVQAGWAVLAGPLPLSTVRTRVCLCIWWTFWSQWGCSCPPSYCILPTLPCRGRGGRESKPKMAVAVKWPRRRGASMMG